jgi:hypothetical protein
MEEEACIVVVASGGGRQTRGSGSVKVEETVFGLLGLVYTGPEQGGRSKNNKLQYFFFFLFKVSNPMSHSTLLKARYH